MVFFLDDVAEDLTIAGIFGSLAAYLFPAAEASAPEVLPGVSGMLTETATETEGGIEYLKSILGRSGDSIKNLTQDAVEQIELLEPEYDEFKETANSIYNDVMQGNIDVKNKEGYVNSISNLIGELGKSIPKDSEGFKQLVTDIVTHAKNNPKKILAAGAVVAGTTAAGVGLMKKLKDDYYKAKRIPGDIKKDIDDIAQTVDDMIPDS
jgi:uncharacterized protein YoxC